MSCPPFNLDKLYFDTLNGRDPNKDKMEFTLNVHTDEGACKMFGEYQGEEGEIAILEGDRDKCEQYIGSTSKDKNCPKTTLDSFYFDDFKGNKLTDRLIFNIRANTKELSQSSSVNRCVSREGSTSAIDCSSAPFDGTEESCLPLDECNFIPASETGNCNISGEYTGTSRDIYSSGSSEICSNFIHQHGQDIESTNTELLSILDKSISEQAHEELNKGATISHVDPNYNPVSGVQEVDTSGNADQGESNIPESYHVYMDGSLISQEQLDPSILQFIESINSDSLKELAYYYLAETIFKIKKEGDLMNIYVITDTTDIDRIINDDRIDVQTGDITVELLRHIKSKTDISIGIDQMISSDSLSNTQIQAIIEEAQLDDIIAEGGIVSITEVLLLSVSMVDGEPVVSVNQDLNLNLRDIEIIFTQFSPTNIGSQIVSQVSPRISFTLGRNDFEILIPDPGQYINSQSTNWNREIISGYGFLEYAIEPQLPNGVMYAVKKIPYKTDDPSSSSVTTLTNTVCDDDLNPLDNISTIFPVIMISVTYVLFALYLNQGPLLQLMQRLVGKNVMKGNPDQLFEDYKIVTGLASGIIVALLIIITVFFIEVVPTYNSKYVFNLVSTVYVGCVLFYFYKTFSNINSTSANQNTFLYKLLREADYDSPISFISFIIFMIIVLLYILLLVNVKEQTEKYISFHTRGEKTVDQSSCEGASTPCGNKTCYNVSEEKGTLIRFTGHYELDKIIAEEGITTPIIIIITSMIILYLVYDADNLLNIVGKDKNHNIFSKIIKNTEHLQYPIFVIMGYYIFRLFAFSFDSKKIFTIIDSRFLIELYDILGIYMLFFLISIIALYVSISISISIGIPDDKKNIDIALFVLTMITFIYLIYIFISTAVNNGQLSNIYRFNHYYDKGMINSTTITTLNWTKRKTVSDDDDTFALSDGNSFELKRYLNDSIIISSFSNVSCVIMTVIFIFYVLHVIRMILNNKGKKEGEIKNENEIKIIICFFIVFSIIVSIVLGIGSIEIGEYSYGPMVVTSSGSGNWELPDKNTVVTESTAAGDFTLTEKELFVAVVGIYSTLSFILLLVCVFVDYEKIRFVLGAHSILFCVYILFISYCIYRLNNVSEIKVGENQTNIEYIATCNDLGSNSNKVIDRFVAVDEEPRVRDLICDAITGV